MLDLVTLYIDPSTASAVAAAILGAVAGVSMYIKTKWSSFRHKVKTDN